MRHILTTTFFFLIFFPFHTEGKDMEVCLDSARAAYDREAYEEALERYQNIAETHISASLLYNMGNAALQADSLGKAVLYYRKARKLAPWNEDIKKNLELALEKTRDDFENDFQGGMLQAFQELLLAAPLGNWWTLSMIASILSGASFFLIIIGQRSLGWISVVLFLFLMGVFYGADKGQMHLQKQKDRCVILSPSVEVLHAPKSNANTAFVLHEGSSVTIDSEEEEWIEVRTPDDQVGWVRKGKLGFY